MIVLEIYDIRYIVDERDVEADETMRHRDNEDEI